MTIIDCNGVGYAPGIAHGEGARQLVRDMLGRWEDIVVRASKRSTARYVSELLEGTRFVQAMATHTPDLLEEMRGIADGAGVSYETILAFNLMDEQWWFDLERPALDPPGCSVLAVAPDSGPPVLAQNMDLPAFMSGGQLVLRLRGDDRPERLILTAAGLVGLTGLNRAGIALCCNTLLMLEHAHDGLPVAAVLRAVLDKWTFDEALGLLQSVRHASGQAYALGSPEGFIGLECSGAGAVVSAPRGRRSLTHTNHPLASPHIVAKLAEELRRKGPTGNSEKRQAFLDDRIDSVSTPTDIVGILADRSTPICVTPVPGKATQTFGTVVYELDEPPRASFCLGLPTSEAWIEPGWVDAGARNVKVTEKAAS
jgi:isopenicillin-N N-acyltransferase-like protein